MKKIIFFELNEVPWRIIKDFCDHHPQSSLADVVSCAQMYETFSEDSELSPWVTWPSVHRGVSDYNHSISNFGQELTKTDEEFPPIWKVLDEAGVSTGIFGSLHTHPPPVKLDNIAFYVPDVFAAGPECFPDKVTNYQRWNLKMSRGSVRNVATGFPVNETIKFLGSLPGLGIRANTLANVGRHLLDERRENWKKVRRRSQQVVLAFDIFLKQLNDTKPAFSSFFTNHVASTMHRYWAAKFPADYEQFGYTTDWQTTYFHEIDWTMGKFDQMLSRLVKFIKANPEYELWIASSMGQAATTAEKPADVQTYLSDIDTLMHYFGFRPQDYQVKPAMAPRHIVKINDQNRWAEFERLTKAIQIANVESSSLAKGEKPELKVKNLENGVFMLRAPVVQNHLSEELVIDGNKVGFADLGFSNTKITDQVAQTAYHITEGSLLIYTPAKNYSHRETEAISSLDIAPALLENFGVPRPAYMNLPGISR